jgi:hypothetical protein
LQKETIMVSRNHYAAARLVSMMAVVTVAMALGAGGCASSTGGGEKIAESYSRTRGLLSSSQMQIDQTTQSMNSLRMTDPTNLNNAFGQYKKSVTALEKKGTDARRLAADLKENMDNNKLSWQKEMDSISDPTVKATAESRKAAVASNYDQLKMYAQDARRAFDTYLKGNQDIVKALQLNLSPAAVSDLSKSMEKTSADGAALKQKIAAMQHAMDNIAKGQAPIGSTAAAAK